MSNVLGAWSFIIGVILAVILGAIGEIGSTIGLVLVVLGIIVGLLNVTDKEVQPFLMAGTVLVIVTALGGSSMDAVPFVGGIFNAIMILFVPATIIVALKSVFTIAKK